LSAAILFKIINETLEHTLIEGVDRSFLENLMELEQSFEERIETERLKLSEKGEIDSKHSTMLDEMA